jgi:hypothetical protein
MQPFGKFRMFEDWRQQPTLHDRQIQWGMPLKAGINIEAELSSSSLTGSRRESVSSNSVGAESLLATWIAQRF